MDMMELTPAGNELSLLPKRLELAKKDRRELNSLLRDYIPFIKKCIASTMFRSQMQEDNLTEAMLAFAHSVQCYKAEYGSFVAFAKMVIRNRLIDCARSELAVEKHIHYEDYQDDEKETPDWDSEQAIQAFNRQKEEENLALEIEEINAEFEKWGFSWALLQKKSPKQERSRIVCRQIARAVQESPSLLGETMEKKALPYTKLLETFPKKALEKFRIYIIALIIIQQGQYPYVYSFVPVESLSEGSPEVATGYERLAKGGRSDLPLAGKARRKK